MLLHTQLFHVAESESNVERGEQLLTKVERKLVEEGYSRAAIEAAVEVSDDPAFAISQAARDDDLIVMGETREPGFERVFGKTYESIAEKVDLPIIVVRDN